MTTFNYDTTVPATSHPPKNDQPTMQTNTASISGLIGVDHIGFNTPNGGAHAQVQLLNVTGGNGTIPVGLLGNGYETLYSSATAGTGELWFVRGAAGTGIQLTGPGTPLTAFRGYTFLPGGLLLQWGFQNGIHGSNHTFDPGDTGTTSFNITFPNQIFNVTCNVNFNSNTAGSPASSSALIIAPDYFNTTTTGFKWQASGSGSSYTVFYWLAIGY